MEWRKLFGIASAIGVGLSTPGAIRAADVSSFSWPDQGPVSPPPAGFTPDVFKDSEIFRPGGEAPESGCDCRRDVIWTPDGKDWYGFTIPPKGSSMSHFQCGCPAPDQPSPSSRSRHQPR